MDKKIKPVAAKKATSKNVKERVASTGKKTALATNCPMLGSCTDNTHNCPRLRSCTVNAGTCPSLKKRAAAE